MLDKNDYELVDYLTAWMAVDMQSFAASMFVVESIKHLLRTYGEGFTTISRQRLMHHRGLTNVN